MSWFSLLFRKKPLTYDNIIYLFDYERKGDVVFVAEGVNLLELRANGDILVKGKLVENDRAVVKGMRDLLRASGHGI